MVEQNSDPENQGTQRVSEPRLPETGENTVDGTRTRQELVHSEPTREEPVEGNGEPGELESRRGKPRGGLQVNRMDGRSRGRTRVIRIV